jgi:acyl dehydratase
LISHALISSLNVAAIASGFTSMLNAQSARARIARRSRTATLQMEIGAVPTDAAAAFNYGLDKVRFLAPVKAGARVRLRVALINVERKGGGVVLKTSNTLEIEGSDKPALIAESLALITPRKSD